MGSRRDNTPRAKRGLSLCSGRHGRTDGVAHAGHVVVSHPPAQIDHGLRQVGVVVQDADDLARDRSVLERGAVRDDAAVRQHCAAQLADYKVPETFTWSDAPLPRNANCRRSGTASAHVPMATLPSKLATAGFIVDARPGHVRVSPYFYNLPDDHRALLEHLPRE